MYTLDLRNAFDIHTRKQSKWKNSILALESQALISSGFEQQIYDSSHWNKCLV